MERTMMKVEIDRERGVGRRKGETMSTMLKVESTYGAIDRGGTRKNTILRGKPWLQWLEFLADVTTVASPL